MKDQDRIEERVRRHHDRAFKAGLVEQSLRPGASVSAIALEAGINANLLFKWRREHLRVGARGTATAISTPVLLPVTIESPTPQIAAAPSPPPASAPAARANTGVIEIEIGGSRVRLRGSVDETSLRAVLTALHSLA